ncbi:MAG: hypothetical protein A2374_00525 [Candidatus Moranbacteria bacterium RIFOXYB1_FULL_44_23]|nr:MAG: hypothetical protein A2374_00525 [Candidatus Moranbacteria bacterium RIFOXYB1_FULL_44_23]
MSRAAADTELLFHFWTKTKKCDNLNRCSLTAEKSNFPKRRQIMPLTAHYLMNHMTRCLPIGDIVLVPGLIGPEEAKQLLNLFDVGDLIISLADEIPSLKNYQTANEKYKQGKFDGAEQFLVVLLNELWQEYIQFRAENFDKDSQEPTWFSRLPRLIKGHLRTQFQFNLEEACPNLTVDVPYTGIRFMYLPAFVTATTEFLKKKDTRRLQFINQLPNLIYPNLSGASLRKRYGHSLGTGAITRVVAFNNCRILPPWLRHTVHIAGNLHDIATAAGGDGIKPADPAHLCEERNAGEILLRNRWRRYFQETDTSAQLVLDIIRGEDEFGLGNLLSQTDRFDYIAGDLQNCIKKSGPSRDESPIFYFFFDHPTTLTVWDCVRLMPAGKSFKTVFTDPARLADLLELRTLMFVHYYYNQSSRSRKAIWIGTAGGFLYSQGKISAQELRRITDSHLDKIVRNHLRIDQAALGIPLTETFSSYEEALARELHLLREGAISATERCTINSAVDESLTFAALGEIVSFREANPKKARELDLLAGTEKPFYVHYIRKPDISTAILEKLKKFRIQQIKGILDEL